MGGTIEELKGCPICGRQPKVKREHALDWDCEVVCALWSEDGKLDHLVSTQGSSPNHDPEESYQIAKRAWNTRYGQ